MESTSSIHVVETVVSDDDDGGGGDVTFSDDNGLSVEAAFGSPFELSWVDGEGCVGGEDDDVVGSVEVVSSRKDHVEQRMTNDVNICAMRGTSFTNGHAISNSNDGNSGNKMDHPHWVAIWG
jgi:hypothetical protein